MKKLTQWPNQKSFIWSLRMIVTWCMSRRSGVSWTPFAASSPELHEIRCWVQTCAGSTPPSPPGPTNYSRRRLSKRPLPAKEETHSHHKARPSRHFIQHKTFRNWTSKFVWSAKNVMANYPWRPRWSKGTSQIFHCQKVSMSPSFRVQFSWQNPQIGCLWHRDSARNFPACACGVAPSQAFTKEGFVFIFRAHLSSTEGEKKKNPRVD